jgi:hypothetical protein
MGDENFDRMVFDMSPLDRRWEWLALGIGVVVALLLNPPWRFFWPLKLYLLIATPLTQAISFWAIYVVLCYNRQLTKILSLDLDVNVFDPAPFEPISKWSLGLSFAIIGSITVSAVLNPTLEEFTDIEGLLTYPLSIIVAVLTFFLTMMSTHNLMVEAKSEKLKEVRLKLSGMFQELEEQKEGALIEDWLKYEKRIEDAPEWPYTTKVLRNWMVSLFLPLIGPLKDLVLDLLRGLMSSP